MMQNINIVRMALIGGAILLSGTPGLAHHSYALFDASKKLSISGVIARVEWVNPHIFIWMYAKNQGGEYELFGFQSGSINGLVHMGWNKNTLTPGEKVTIDYYPLKDGRSGGAFAQAVHADGSISVGDGIPGASSANVSTEQSGQTAKPQP